MPPPFNATYVSLPSEGDHAAVELRSTYFEPSLCATLIWKAARPCLPANRRGSLHSLCKVACAGQATNMSMKA